MNKHIYDTVLFEQHERIAWVTLNRPEVHNAFNPIMMSELISVFENIRKDKGIRVAVMTGKGKSFCAGADLNWMRDIIDYSFEQNLEESMLLAELHYKIFTLPKPTIAMVNGAAIGGGTGLLSVCDFALSSDRAKFGLSEVKIGLVPAVISPYVVRKIGESTARQYFLTGQRMSAEKACEIGLVNEVVAHEQLENKVKDLTEALLTCGPEAIACCKELLFCVPRMGLEEAKSYTARMIAELRISDEGQEGIAAFLEKRKPVWDKVTKTHKDKG
jgi:methylglutaconyl-CoA hydratase